MTAGGAGVRRGLVAGLASCCWLLSCEQPDRAPTRPSAVDDGTEDAGLEIDAGRCPGAPDPSSQELCGSTLIPVELPRTNLYFVIDRSGSMGDPLAGSIYSKYTNARFAVSELMKAIGHRVFFGGAVFPGPNSELGCDPGVQVFETTAGDPLGATCGDELGPNLLDFQTALSRFGTEDGTPISATFEALLPTLTALPGKTAVILATDGAPNCNPDISCGPEQCMLNLEGATVRGKACTAEYNCCDPVNVPDGPSSCVDAQSSGAAVTALLAAGISTYVVGMPGSEQYAAVLSELARAGGTARDQEPPYYSARDTEELTAVLRDIGTSVAVSCQVQLANTPPDPSLVNVYFDQQLVVANAESGWAWTGPAELELRGSSCSELKGGNVRQVLVTAGCPTRIE